MQIAVFCAYYPSHGGGVELACERLVRDLLADHKQVRWLAQQDGDLPDLPLSSCLPLRGTDLIYRISGVPFPIPFPSAVGAIVDAVRTSHLAVIVEANFLVCVVAYLAASIYRKKVLLVQHVGQPSSVSRLARVVMSLGEVLFTRRIVRNADAVVYVSPTVARHFAEIRDGALTEIIGHAIDTDLFDLPVTTIQRRADRSELGLPENGRLACFVGRITESKGAFVIRQLAQARSDWTIAIAGNGPLDPGEWGLSNVHALGLLSQPRVAQLYRCSDAMVLPSQSESFSLVVREAMASGCRVICGEQILETDPGLAPFVTTVPIDLTDVSRTARHFSQELDRPTTVRPADMRSYVMQECSPAKTRNRYLDLVDGLLAACNARQS